MKQNDLYPLTLLKNVKIKYLDLQTYTSTFSPPCSTVESKEASQVGSGLVVCPFAFPSISWPSSAFPSTTGGDSAKVPFPGSSATCFLLYPQSTGCPGKTERWENGEAAGESFPTLCFTSCRPGPLQATPAMDRISIQLCIDCVPLLSSSSRASSG